jgi:hypothetical protein
MRTLLSGLAVSRALLAGTNHFHSHGVDPEVLQKAVVLGIFRMLELFHLKIRRLYQLRDMLLPILRRTAKRFIGLH